MFEVFLDSFYLLITVLFVDSILFEVFLDSFYLLITVLCVDSINAWADPFASDYFTCDIHISPFWGFSYLSAIIYLIFIFSTVLYILPNAVLFTGSHSTKTQLVFLSNDGYTVIRLLLTPVVLIFILHASWSGPTLTAWFGHILFASLQSKFTYMLFFFFVSYILAFASSSHYSSLGIYDFTITIFNFFLWTWLTLLSNNLFTFIFFLELLSALVTLLLVTSTFTSTHFYNLTSYSQHAYFNSSTPNSLVQALLAFFWTTLVSSLLLFVLLIFVYIQFLTFDWNLIDAVFGFVITNSSIKLLFSSTFTWLLFLTAIFIKCGIVPLYLWKPTLFKGITLISLFFYVYVYYFTVFFFLLYAMFFYLNELFMFNLHLITLLLIVGTFMISPLLFESFYLKAFLALSSILNSLLLFYALSSSHILDLVFIL